MKVSLLYGHSPAIIAQNADALHAAGDSFNTAAKKANNFARASFFRSIPHGSLPPWLIVGRDGTAAYYDSNGAHIAKFKAERSRWMENNATLYSERPSRHRTDGPKALRS